MTNKLPEFFEKKTASERWDWFDRQKSIMVDAAEKGGTVTIGKEQLSAFVHMMQLDDLQKCEVITMHQNAVVIMACAAIEDDLDATQEWLLNALEQADCAEWQMYESAEEFYQRNRLPWPESQADHRKNVERNNAITKEDAEKFEIWYEENVMTQLRAHK